MKIEKKTAFHRSKQGIFLIVLSAAVTGIVISVAFTNHDAVAPVPAKVTITPATKPEPRNEKSTDISEIPSRLIIDKIGVNASIQPVGLTSDGNLDAPKTNEGVGWYKKSALLGQTNFSVLLDGHFGTPSQPAVFYRLSELRIGDTLTIEGEKGSQVQYAVKETENTPLEEVDMKKALYPYRKDIQSLTIITCDGDYDQKRDTYDKRHIVYAERVS